MTTRANLVALHERFEICVAECGVMLVGIAYEQFGTASIPRVSGETPSEQLQAGAMTYQSAASFVIPKACTDLLM
jgi:hypothetical protein